MVGSERLFRVFGSRNGFMVARPPDLGLVRHWLVSSFEVVVFESIAAATIAALDLELRLLP